LIKALEKEEPSAMKKPSFDVIAQQMTQALEEMRIADAKF